MLTNQRKLAFEKELSLSLTSSGISISLIQEAYTTLSFPESRKQYDATLLSRAYSHPGSASRSVASRPAQIISLEEFTVERPHEEGRSHLSSQDAGGGWESETYTYPCRCGGEYRLATADLESGHHVVGCETCSEVIWVGYEEVADEDSAG